MYLGDGQCYWTSKLTFTDTNRLMDTDNLLFRAHICFQTLGYSLLSTFPFQPSQTVTFTATPQ